MVDSEAEDEAVSLEPVREAVRIPEKLPGFDLHTTVEEVREMSEAQMFGVAPIANWIALSPAEPKPDPEMVMVAIPELPIVAGATPVTVSGTASETVLLVP